jgi:hypothetical protein
MTPEIVRLTVPPFRSEEAFGMSDPSDSELTGVVRAALAEGDPSLAVLAISRVKHPELRASLSDNLELHRRQQYPTFLKFWAQSCEVSIASSKGNRLVYTTMDGLDTANICRMVMATFEAAVKHPLKRFEGQYVKAHWRFDGKAQRPGFKLQRPPPAVFWIASSNKDGGLRFHINRHRGWGVSASDLRELPIVLDKHPGIPGPSLLQRGWEATELYAPPPSGASRALWAQLENSHRLAEVVPPNDPIAKLLIPLNPVFTSSDPVILGWLP